MVACGQGGESGEEKRFVGASEVCDGIFSGALAKKVEFVTGDVLFTGTGTKGRKLEKVVEELKMSYASGREWGTGANLCEMKGKGGGVSNRAVIGFHMYAEQDLENPRKSVSAESYTMGKRSEAGKFGALVYLECVSPQLKGSDATPLRIYGNFTRGKSDVPDARAARDASLEILHAGALAVVKELGCENSAGLPESASVTLK